MANSKRWRVRSTLSRIVAVVKVASKNARLDGSLRWILFLLLGVLAGIAVVSCASVDRVELAPPQIPGATYVGSAACEQCHQDTFRGFNTATHYHLKAPGDNAKDIGCESCHGPGSVHIQSGGAANTIVNPRKSP